MIPIAYPNLSAEMTRHNVNAKDIASVLGINPSGVYLMLRGQRDISVERAKAIRLNFFPNLSLEYLFDKSQCN